MHVRRPIPPKPLAAPPDRPQGWRRWHKPRYIQEFPHNTCRHPAESRSERDAARLAVF